MIPQHIARFFPLFLLLLGADYQDMPTPIPSRVPWVFFDLDDTLWDFSSNSLKALAVIYTDTPQLRPFYADFKSFADAYHAINDKLWNLYHHGLISTDYLKTERFEAVTRVIPGIRDAHKLARTMNDAYLATLSDYPDVVDGALDLLKEVAPHCLIGILSNGFRNTQYRKLAASGLDRYVQRMVISDEIGIQKPDKRLFDYALQATGADRRSLVWIGDNPDADIKGGIEAGWNTIYFNRKWIPYQGPGDPPVADTLQEVKKLLLARFRQG